MNKKLFLIFNPFAGKGQIKNNIYEMIDIFVKGGYDVTVYPTQKKHDACQKIQSCANDFDLIVCSGGDGTLNEVVSGLMKLQKRPPVGYVPAGTTNDFATTLHLSKNMQQACMDIRNGRNFSCDVGAFNRRSFIYVASFGIFTDVAYNTPQQYKNMFGPVAYFLEGIKELSAVQSYRLQIEYEGNTLDDTYIFGAVSNSTSVAGFQSYHPENVKLDDGLFEVLLIREPQNLFELHSIVTSLLWQTPNPQFIRTFSAANLKITSEQKLPWTLDGEFGGSFDTVTIQNKKHAIDLIIPDTEKASAR